MLKIQEKNNIKAILVKDSRLCTHISSTFKKSGFQILSLNLEKLEIMQKVSFVEPSFNDVITEEKWVRYEKMTIDYWCGADVILNDY